VSRIVKKELNLKCFKRHRATESIESNKVSRLLPCKKLLRRFPDHKVSFIFFPEEKLFTVARPTNKQNDRVYAPATPEKSTYLLNGCCERNRRSANQ
jgi:inhibitor of nuclear factor kappa-B kinase subunit alpha